MAFNALEYLEQGKVDFLSRISLGDQEYLINLIRKSQNKNNIINGFLSKLKRVMPYFCFEIIYDTDEYVEELFDLVSGRLGYKIGYNRLINDYIKIKNILYNTTWGREFVFRNLTNIVRANENNIDIILSYIFSSFEDNVEFIRRLSVYEDLHIRYLFMKYLIQQHYDKIDLVYDNIFKYLINYNYKEYEQLSFLPELMNVSDVSDLAVCVLYYNKDFNLWNKLKEYILVNYKNNDLAKLLLNTVDKDSLMVNEFKKDADRLFITSNDYKYDIYCSCLGYRNYLSKEVLDDFEKYLKYFKNTNNFFNSFGDISKICYYKLWDELISYVDKYLAFSKDKSFGYLSSGSTSSCYKIGDYVFKIINGKHSQEDIICPDLYLIIKNLEQHYIRNANGDVVCGIEVQKYLSRKDIRITSENIIKFEETLGQLGYYVSDKLMNSIGGDNCAILDSYRDADCSNPENLPDWFKAIPLVLIDRDLVYKLEKKRR